jgi:predicted deacylase
MTEPPEAREDARVKLPLWHDFPTPRTDDFQVELSGMQPRSASVRFASVLFAMLIAAYATSAGAAPAGSGSAAQPAADWGPLELLSRSVAPGTKAKFPFAATRTFEAAFLDTPIFAARGATAGPSLCVTSAIHGDEINSVEIARRVFAGIDPARLHGTLLVVPAVNASGFRTMNRYMPDRRDLNRAFPGATKGSVASLVANAVFENVIRRCDALIDLHTGSNFRTNVAQIRVDVDEPKSLELAESFGVGVIIAGAGPSGSLRREAVRAGLAAIIYESGPPYVFVEKEIENGTRGVLNVMDHLGMYATPGKKPHAQTLARSSWLRVPRGKGGIYLSAVRLGDSVKVGDLLGTIADPVTDEVYEIRAQRAGVVVGAALPQVVLSGYGLFHIGELE